MKRENGSSDVHVLYHSTRWHIYWNLFAHGYRKYAVNFKRYTSVSIEYCFWVSFGKGNLSFTFRPTKHAPDVVESAASVSISPASEVSASEADSTPATTQVM